MFGVMAEHMPAHGKQRIKSLDFVHNFSFPVKLSLEQPMCSLSFTLLFSPRSHWWGSEQVAALGLAAGWG